MSFNPNIYLDYRSERAKRKAITVWKNRSVFFVLGIIIGFVLKSVI